MNDIEQKIEFTRIRELLVAECSNTLAVRMCAEMRFSSDYERVLRELRQTKEMLDIVMLESGFPNQDYIDMSDDMERLRVGNTVIEKERLVDLKCSIRTISECVKFLMKDNGLKYPNLQLLARRVDMNPDIYRELNKLVDEHGEIYDNASPLLKEIRHEKLKKSNEVDAQISRSLNKAKREGWAPEDGEVTIRNGRMVIPMIDTHRRKMKGLIHDESATRQTAYLEPAEVVELNNDLRELDFAERREVHKILLRFCDMLRPELDKIRSAYWFLARIDFLRAKAKLALRLHWGMPIVVERPQIIWIGARHPLLKGEVVPFDMELKENSRILIISGPNAGGKSVCLKAVGLIQYMLQCGLLVPCRETSEFGIFDQIFIDIGDQQSIDNELSTYTSHLQNMKSLLTDAGPGTLFLLDELGGGTEPRSGCAIAEALLEELYSRGAYGVVTTHYADLKLLADRYDGIRNGAMMFDTERMKPLYRLNIGHPGSSFAFEIARNIGFPENVLTAAGEKVGQEMLNFEHQLQQITLEKQEILRQKTELEVSDQFLNEVIAKYQKLTEKLESRKYDILTSARNEAKSILEKANKTVEQTIYEIKAAQAEKEATQQARAKMKEEEERLVLSQEKHKEERMKARKENKIDDTLPSQESPDSEIIGGEVLVGDIVRIDGQDSYGEVVEIKGKKAVVESNSLRMTIALNRLQKTRKKQIPADRTKRQESRFQSIFNDINEKRKYFNPTLDLRGQRGDEAIAMLQHHIDEAQLLGEKELRILHGKGYGILKTLVRETLQHHSEVRSFETEKMELGGDGITVVHLK